MKTRSVYYSLTMLLMLALVLVACAPAVPQMSAAQDKSYGGAAPAAPAPREEPAREMESPASGNNAAPGQAPGLPRLVIKNATVSVIVPDPGQSMETISRMAAEMGGYVVSANLFKEWASSGVETPRAAITIRVPAERLDEALLRIQAESKQDAQNLTITSQDVTNEYVDLQSRLKNLQAAEVELTRIMQDANRTEDVLAVYQQLVSIREQIEVIQGQIKYYEQSAALSSVSVDLIADAAVQPVQIGGWQPTGVAKNAIESLVRALQGLVDLLIWLVLYLLPILLILALIFVLPPVLILRAILRRRKRNTPPAPPAAPAAE